MRMRIYLSISLLIASISVVFCQQSDISQRLPNDALMVFNFNLGNINSKIDLQKIKKLEMMEFAFANIKKSMGKDSSIAKKFYADPNTYGINLLPSVTICFRQTTNEFGEPSANSLILFNLSNVKKFEKFMKTIYDNGTEYKDFLETRGAYRVFQASSSVFIWNTTSMYIIPLSYSNRETIEDEIESITKLSKTNSLVTESTFSDKSISSNDINFWMNYEKMIKYSEESEEDVKKKLFNVNYDRIKGSETSFALDFNEGKILISSLSKVNEVLRKENNSVFSREVNKEFFNYVDGDSLIGFYSMAFNIDEMKKSIENNYKNLLDTLEHVVEKEALKKIVDTNKTILSLQKQLDSDTLDWNTRWEIKDSLDHISDSLVNRAMKDIGRIVDSTFNEFGMTRADAWNLFKGDFMIASTGMYYVLDTVKTFEYSENEDGEMDYHEVEKAEKSPRPLFLTMATVNLVDKCKYALVKLEKEGILKKQDDYYYVSITKYDFYIKLNGDVLIFTNDKNVVNRKYQKGKSFVSKPVSDDLITKSIKSPLYMYLDIEKILAKIPIDSDSQKKMMSPAIDVFGNFESKSELLGNNDMASATAFNFKKSGNSIHILFDLANEYYKLLTSMY